MGCNEDEYIKELQEEKTKLLQEIRTLTNERVEFRAEIKELKKQINSTIGMNDRDIYWKNFYKMAIQERQIIKQVEEIKRLKEDLFKKLTYFLLNHLDLETLKLFHDKFDEIVKEGE